MLLESNLWVEIRHTIIAIPECCFRLDTKFVDQELEFIWLWRY